MLEKAIEIAVHAHREQVDKGGSPYILHPLRVMLALNNRTEQICAVLHDVIEDTSVTIDDLRREGFDQTILEVLQCLTRKQDESYDEFISRILTNDTACRIKLADITDNMDLNRIPAPGVEDMKRIEKYQAAACRIKERLNP